MKFVRVVSAMLAVLSLTLAAGCSTAPADGQSGESSSKSSGGY